MKNAARPWCRLLCGAIALLAPGFLAVGIIVNRLVDKASCGRCYHDVEALPFRRVGLLLGTSRLTPSGYLNTYFIDRVEACASLYACGKITRVLVSGDSGSVAYNEPRDMKNALVALGIPADSVTLDYYGFRTYDSMFRAQKAFGQDSVTVITQQWHGSRAIYIADHFGLDAQVYCARNAAPLNVVVKMKVREWLARIRMAADLRSADEPRFIGQSVEI